MVSSLLSEIIVALSPVNVNAPVILPPWPFNVTLIGNALFAVKAISDWSRNILFAFATLYKSNSVETGWHKCN